jgi:hypothetical protein
MVGKAEYDELGFWLDQINLLNSGELIDLILNDRLIMQVSKTRDCFDLAIYSRYNIDYKRRLIEIEAKHCLYHQSYKEDEYIDMDNYIDFVFGKYVKSAITAKDIATGLIGTTVVLTALAAMTCVAACV